MRALVFSGGGAFGAYQAGAWRALEDAGFGPQILVGASIGAVNAAAVARGATGRDLERWWRDPRSNVFQWNWPPRAVALFDTRLWRARLEELYREFPRFQPGIRLLVTLTELPGAAVRVAAGEEVTPLCVLASCALPGVSPPVKWRGRWYLDGGLFCRMPLGLAAEAGATDIVAVDLLAAPPSTLLRGIAVASVAVRRLLRGGAEPDLSGVPPGTRLRVISSPEPLGGVRDTLRWNPALVERWIQAGYRDATAALESRAAEASSPQPLHQTPSAAQPSKPSMDRAAPQ